MKGTYAYPERTIDLDAVAELFYDNLVEEVYRAMGGDGLPFFTMLAEGGELRDRLLEAARGYLRSIEETFLKCGVYNSSQQKLTPRVLRIERLTPNTGGRRPLYQDCVEVPGGQG